MQLTLKRYTSTGSYTEVGIRHMQHLTHIRVCCRRRQSLAGPGLHHYSPYSRQTIYNLTNNKPSHSTRSICSSSHACHIVNKPSHSTPLPTGEGLGVGLFPQSCKKTSISSHRHVLHDTTGEAQAGRRRHMSLPLPYQPHAALPHTRTGDGRRGGGSWWRHIQG